MNQINMTGGLTADPELKYTQGKGTPIASFTLAVNRPHTFGQNKKTDFIRCTVWGKSGEYIAEHAVKGTRIGVGGYLTITAYDAQDGSKKYIADVVVEDYEFLTKPANLEGSPSGGSTQGNNNSDSGDMEPVDEGSIPF